MPKYKVGVMEVHVQAYIVEADSPKDAKNKVFNLEGDIVEGEFEYSHTLDKDKWHVIKLEK